MLRQHQLEVLNMTTKPFERDVSCRYGAPMGRRSDNPDLFDGIKIRLCRVHLYDGAYDKGGAYWGMGKPLYCAWGENSEEQLVCYFRADNRETAKTTMRTFGAIIR
jgi:hypothetical protein